MYFFATTSDGRRIDLAFLPGDEEYYGDMIMRARQTPHDHSRQVLSDLDWQEVMQRLEAIGLDVDGYLGSDHE